MKQLANSDNKILVISGATCSGKSSLADEIRDKIESSIINADSIQIYKELPILSAQPSKEKIEDDDYYLYSILSHNDKSSLKYWLDLTTRIINESFDQNKLPIIVGGTGMYISKLIKGINEIPEIDPSTREDCLNLYNNGGKEALLKKLIELGDNSSDISNLDKQRLIRRLEVFRQTGKSITYWQELEVKKFFPEENFIHINLDVDRDTLYDNCNKRFEKMIRSGAIEESQRFLELKPSLDSLVTKTIGFNEIKLFLEGAIDKDKMIEEASKNTRNYAKRQLTWFRNQFDNKTIILNVSHETTRKVINLL